MRRYAGAVLMLGVLGGCMNIDYGVESGGMRPNYGKRVSPPTVPGVQGPYGAPVPMAAPYSSAPPGSQWAAQQMMSRSLPMNMVQMNNPVGMGMPGPGGSTMPPVPVPPGGILSPPGMPFAPGAPSGGSVQQTSFNQGGVMPANMPPGAPVNGGIMQAQLALNPGAAGMPLTAHRTQVRFVRPTGMQVSWFTQGPAGPMYSTTPIETPGRYNFVQGAKYRLKLSNLEGRPGLEIYPTLEVVPGNPKTEAFLAHSAVPVEFTPEDFRQVAEGNYVVKVIYLPDPAFQDVAVTGIGEILSTQLEPGQDPIQEALRRGSILLVIRMGNIDQEAPNTPGLGTPGPAGQPGGHGAPALKFGPTMPGPGMAPLQVPYWGMPGAGQQGPTPPAMPGMPGAGMFPPNVIGPPPAPVPPGQVPPPGMMPPGVVPPGLLPGGAVPNGIPPIPPPTKENGIPPIPPPTKEDGKTSQETLPSPVTPAAGANEVAPSPPTPAVEQRPSPILPPLPPAGPATERP